MVYLVIAVAVALVASFFLLLFKKIGIVEWLQVHGGSSFRVDRDRERNR